MVKRILLAAASVLIAAPALAQSAATIQKLNDKWAGAFNKGDAAAVAAMYAPDAYVLPPGHDMVKGRSAIEAFWKQAAQEVGNAKLVSDRRAAARPARRPRNRHGHPRNQSPDTATGHR